MTDQANPRPIVIRRKKKVIHVHAGGSWKIALADFMTALMALFLVMWILSQASPEERQAVGEYFRTPLVTAMAGGDGMAQTESVIPGGGPDPTFSAGEVARISVHQQTRPSDIQRRAFRDLQQRIEIAIAANPDLREMRDQMRFDMTMEGLRIQLIDSDKRPMFDLGSDNVEPHMSELLQTMAPLFNEVQYELRISGHTDNLPYVKGYQGYSNWELAADRANASRRELIAGGLSPYLLLGVSGLADRVPTAEASDADDPINRRIELFVLFDEAADAIRNPATLKGSAWQVPAETAKLDTTAAMLVVLPFEKPSSPVARDTTPDT